MNSIAKQSSRCTGELAARPRYSKFSISSRLINLAQRIRQRRLYTTKNTEGIVGYRGSVSKSVEIHAKRNILSASTSSFSENCRGDSVNRPPEIIKWASQGSPLQMLE